MTRSLIASLLRAVWVILRATYVLSRSSDWQLAGSRADGWHSIRITGSSGISLHSDVFGSTFTAPLGAVPCTQAEVLGATYPVFMQPHAAANSTTFSIVAAVSGSSQPLSAGRSNGLIASLRGLDLALSSSQGTLQVTLSAPAASTGSGVPAATFTVPAAGKPASSLPTTLISLTQGPDGRLLVCIDGQEARLLRVDGWRSPAASQLKGGWTTLPFLAGWAPLGADVGGSGGDSGDLVIGDPYGAAATLQLDGLWLLLQGGSGAWGCGRVNSTFRNLLPPISTGTSASSGTSGDASLQYTNMAPELVGAALLSPPLGQDAFLSDTVSFSATLADPDGDSVRARVTLFGAPAVGCTSASCGALIVSVDGQAGQPILLQASAKYARAGRYIIRLEATDGRGGLLTQDFPIIVRKNNDTARAAPCCRYTGTLITAQQGRPIHSTVYRHPSLYGFAASLGWPQGYMDREDLESERLFDYGLLAPRPFTDPASALRPISCADTRIGGAGGAPVPGLTTPRQYSLNHGVNKRALILPQGYDWALNVAPSLQPACQAHWSEWAASSPVRGAAKKDSKGNTLEFCSYTCTPEGVASLADETGALDRWMEQIIEMTYGQVSMHPQVDVTPTLWVPYANPTNNPFLYTDAPTHPFLISQGINETTDYRVIMVLAPLPRHANPQGYTAWSSAPTMMFILLCNPMHYYLVHEMGHLFGLPHATMYKLDNATVLPTNPLGPGVIEDSYTDKFDTMACCKGDYNVFFRMLAGWVPASERYDINLLTQQYNGTSRTDAPGGTASDDGSPATNTTTMDLVLWPFDRGESRGKLKAATMRISVDELLVLSYRSAPFWQDVRLGAEGYTSATDSRLGPDQMRGNVAGLSVEYARQYTDASGQPQWTTRGLLDFNLLFPLWPDAFPKGPGAYAQDPPRAAFAHLREGFTWSDASRGFAITVRKVAECDSQAEVPVYNYSVPGFFGFRGEYPGQQQFDRSDFSGYASGLQCLHVTVKTGIAQQPGSLDMRVRVGGPRLTPQYQVELSGMCGFPLTPTLSLSWPAGGRDLAAIVWKDAANRTFAVDSASVLLPPPLAALVESSASGSPTCAGPTCPPGATYWLKAAAADGSHSMAKLQLVETALDHYLVEVKYIYFLADKMLTASEAHYVPILRSAPTTPQQPRGLLLPQPLGSSGGAAGLLGQGYVDVGASQLPDSSCSQQWTLTMLLKLPTAATLSSGVPALPLFLMAQTPGDSSSSQPGIWLLPPSLKSGSSSSGSSSSSAALMVSWKGSAQAVDISGAIAQSVGGILHVAVVRDGSHLGVWANGIGSWLLPDLTCVPTGDSAQRTCGGETRSGGSDPAFTPLTLRLYGPPLQLQASQALPATVMVTAVRMYNYALPQMELAAEASCADAGTCGRFFLAGWTPKPYGGTGRAPGPGSVTALDGAVSPGIRPGTQRYNISGVGAGGYSYYIDVGPWGPCSSACGSGGRRVRDVQCLRIGLAGTQALPADQCLVASLPTASEPCNTLACPSARLEVVAPPGASVCSPSNLTCAASTAAEGAADGSDGTRQLQVMCRSSIGFLLPLSSCTNASLRGMSNGSLDGPVDIFAGDSARPSASWSDVELDGQQLGIPPSGGSSSANVTLQAAIAPGSTQLQLSCLSTDLLPHATPCGTTGAVAAPYWQLGSWSLCSMICGGGTRSRTASCVTRQGGEGSQVAVASATCSALYGQLLVSFLSQPCNSQPCTPVAWMVGAWGGCVGDSPSGYSQRQASCSSAFGAALNASVCGGSTITSTLAVATVRPSASAACFAPPEGTALCKYPGMVGTPSCSGRGTCTYTGCQCLDQSQGQFCEVPPSCPSGVMDSHTACCASGVLDQDGACCPPGPDPALDAAGRCCPDSSSLDACGVCGGAAQAVDMAGTCCPGPLDQSGVCCTSGFVDECGLCDGDSTSCSLVLSLELGFGATSTGLNSSSSSSGGDQAAEWELALVDRLASAARAAGLPSSVSLLPYASTLNRSSASPMTTTNLFALLTFNSSGSASNGPGGVAVNSSNKASAMMGNGQGDGSSSNSSTVAGAVAAAVSGSFRYTVSGLIPLLAASLAAPLTLPPPQGSFPSSAAGSPSFVSAPSVRILMVDRAGVCGNGVCEVGEQTWEEPWASASAQAPCPADCPFSFRRCPAPSSSSVGNPSLECGGHGACMRGSGSCVCFDGYFGDDCGSCGLSYWPTPAGLCVRQFINGKTLYQLQDLVVPEPPPAHASSLHLGPLTTTHFITIVAGGGSLVLLVAAAIACLFVRKSRKVAADRAKAAAAAEEEAAAAVAAASSMGKPFGAAAAPSTPIRFRRNAEKLREAARAAGLGGNFYYAGSPPDTPSSSVAPHLISPDSTPSAAAGVKARKGDGRDAFSNTGDGGTSPSPRHAMNMRHQEEGQGGAALWGSSRDRTAVRDQQGAGGWPASPAGVCVLPQSTRGEGGTAGGASLLGGGRPLTSSPRAGQVQPSDGSSGMLGWARLLGLVPPAVAGPPGSPDAEAGRRGSAGSSPRGLPDQASLTPVKTRRS